MPAPTLSETCVVVPTYNEKDNLGVLVERLRAAAPQARIVVVDDGSPDGTGQAAEALSERFSRVQVIHRPGKGGRGSACIAGFRAALRSPEVRCVVEMDADLSHDPAEVPALVAALAEADVVIASRYAEGSRVVGRPWRRRALSLLANAFARAALGLPFRDCTYGLRAYSRAALESVDLERVPGSGFVVLVGLLHALRRKGLRVREVPSVFVDRRRGTSNLGLREMAEGLVSVLKLALRPS